MLPVACSLIMFFRHFAWFLLLSLLAGCGDAPPAPPPVQTASIDSSSNDTVSQVCEIAANLMGVTPSSVRPSTTLGDLSADELDAVELVMDLEEHFDVAIPDEALKVLTGKDNWADFPNVSMSQLAEVVEQQK